MNVLQKGCMFLEGIVCSWWDFSEFQIDQLINMRKGKLEKKRNVHNAGCEVFVDYVILALWSQLDDN